MFSNKHCSLCDITHGKAKKEWEVCERRLPITIDFIHLNERNEAIRKYTEGVTPCVIGKTAAGYVMVVTKNEMNDCNGDAKKFEKLIVLNTSLNKIYQALNLFIYLFLPSYARYI